MTFLHKTPDGDLKTSLIGQLQKVHEALKAHIKAHTSPRTQFMGLLRTQVRLRQEDFTCLGIGSRVRVACFVFHNFVDKLLALRFFGDVMADVRLVERVNMLQSR